MAPGAGEFRILSGWLRPTNKITEIRHVAELLQLQQQLAG